MATRKTYRVWAALALALSLSSPAAALESDQFTLPPEPLADIGPEIDAALRAIIDKAMAEANARIAELEAKREATTRERARTDIDEQIAELLDPMQIARAIKQKWGNELPVTTFEKWIVDHEFVGKPAYYKADFGDTVLADQALWKPLLIGAMSPTIKAHGVHQGADKLGHLFQQGFDYYKKYRTELDDGSDTSEATAAAVKWGVDMEKTWGGQWWTGVYSNSDLASNFAGMRFYTNLGEPVKVGQRTMPRLLVTDDRRWAWNPETPADWFAVYISEHMDEAMNPPRMDKLMRGGVRKRIKQRGASWVAHWKTDRAGELARLTRLSTWHGEPYGHSGLKDLVTIVSAYFDKVD